jgi:hypothetical protein
LPAVQQVDKPGFAVVPVPESVADKAGSSGAKNVIRTVVGVYGPVAVIVSAGVWLLGRKR